MNIKEFELDDIRKGYESFDSLLDYLYSVGQVGGWDWNVDKGELVWTNETFRIFGLEPNSVKPNHEFFLSIVYPDDHRVVNQDMDIEWDEKITYSADFRAYKGKEIRVCRSVYKVLCDEDNNLIRMSGIIQDITERNDIENEIIAAKEKAEALNMLKTEFLNNISHEVRTPMNGILGFSNMLNKPGLSEEKRKKYIKVIQSSGNQLLRVIDDIIEISTLGTNQEKVNESDFSLNEMLYEIFSIFNIESDKKNIELRINTFFDNKKCTIKSDRVKLHRILSNLIDNAIKYTVNGYVEFGYELEDNSLTFYVKDTGIGISRKKHIAIFERFSQENKNVKINYGGLGLGLSISKENANLLGGNIILESEKDKGSTFYLTIPYKPVSID